MFSRPFVFLGLYFMRLAYVVVVLVLAVVHQSVSYQYYLIYEINDCVKNGSILLFQKLSDS